MVDEKLGADAAGVAQHAIDVRGRRRDAAPDRRARAHDPQAADGERRAQRIGMELGLGAAQGGGRRREDLHPAVARSLDGLRASRRSATSRPGR